MDFIGVLILILLSTTIISHFCIKLAIPEVVGQLLIGVILGKSFLNIVDENQIVSEFSQIGVILLMFIAGLDSNIKLLRQYLKPSIFVACLGVLIPILFGLFGGLLFNIPTQQAIMIGILMAPTSVSISVSVLKELNVLDSKEGATILGAAIFDDILGVVILSVAMSLMVQNDSTISSPLLLDFVKEAIFFVGCYILMRWVAPYIIRLGNKLKTEHAPLITSLLICFSMAYIASAAGLSDVIGAFVAGVAVAHSHVKEDISLAVEKIGYSLFIPVFFVSVGLSIQLSDFNDQVIIIISFTILAILSKIIGSFIGAKLNHFSNNSSLMIGSGMVSRGEMALIIAHIGLAHSLISPDLYTAMIIVIILTTLISPFLLEYFTLRVFHKKTKIS